jgi:hypothetical protein
MLIKIMNSIKYIAMEKKTVILCLMLTLIGLTSCQKFLTQLPQDSVSPQNYYETPDQLTSALMAVYAELGNTDESTYSRFLSLEAGNSADDIYTRSSSNASAASFNTTSSYANFNNCWNALYTGIERANLLIQAIPGSPVADATKNKILGEALFLRSYYYFVLVTYYGDVPLKLKATTGVTDISFPRTPAAQVYDQIIKDMTTAEGLVATAAVQNTTARISQTGVQGILAKVYLHAAGRLNKPEYYAQAKTWAMKVINSGVHSLNPDYSKIFINESADVEDWKECIWEVGFYSTNPSVNFSYERFGSTVGINNTNTLNAFMQGLYQGTGNYYNAFGKGDTRRDWTLAPFYYIGGSSAATIEKGSAPVDPTAVWGRSMAKWRRTYQTAGSIGIKNFGGTNWPLLRYADVLLMAAEADNEVNGPTDAVGIALINQVRERGYGKAINGQWVYSATITNGGTGYTVAPVVTISGGGASRAATATATISAGKVTAITITDGGAGFTSVPTISIAAPTTGTTALATAVLFDYNTQCDLPPAAQWTQATLRQEIMLERSLELGGEGHRKLDLVRWGTFLTTMQNMKTIFTSGQAAYNIGPLSIQATPAAPTSSATTTYGYTGRTSGIAPYNNASARDVLFPIPIAETQLNPAIPASAQNTGW